MGRNYFTDEQIDEFKKNKYIKSITKANITFTKEFKKQQNVCFPKEFL